MLGRLLYRVGEVALTGVVFTASSTLTKKLFDYFEGEKEDKKEETKEPSTVSVTATTEQPPLL